jgi:hypothetical protein
MFASTFLLQIRQVFFEAGENMRVQWLAEVCHASGDEARVQSQPGAMHQDVFGCVNSSTIHEQHYLGFWPF